jgi:hypothetical protein
MTFEFSLFWPAFTRGPMPITIQVSCQSRKTAENWIRRGELGDFANQDLVGFPTVRWEHSPAPARRASSGAKEFGRMIGKLLGAWVGEKIAGRNSRAKGAILGAGAVAVAKRAVPTIVALAVIGWGVNKLRRLGTSPTYPSEATPSPPSG